MSRILITGWMEDQQRLYFNQENCSQGIQRDAKALEQSLTDIQIQYRETLCGVLIILYRLDNDVKKIYNDRAHTYSGICRENNSVKRTEIDKICVSE